MSARSKTEAHLSGLLERQRRFVVAYVDIGCAAAAAREAGYAASSSLSHVYRMMRRPDIQRAIELEHRRRAAEGVVRQEQVIADLMAIAESRETPAASRVKALIILGRYAGLDRPRQKNASRVTVVMDGRRV